MIERSLLSYFSLQIHWKSTKFDAPSLWSNLYGSFCKSSYKKNACLTHFQTGKWCIFQRFFRFSIKIFAKINRKIINFQRFQRTERSKNHQFLAIFKRVKVCISWLSLYEPMHKLRSSFWTHDLIRFLPGLDTKKLTFWHAFSRGLALNGEISPL